MQLVFVHMCVLSTVLAYRDLVPSTLSERHPVAGPVPRQAKKSRNYCWLRISQGMELNAHIFALRVPHGLIHAQNQRGSLRSAVDRVDLNQARFPNESLHVVTDSLRPVDVHTKPDVPVRVTHSEFVQDIRGIETCIVAYLARKDLQSFGECQVDKLEFSRDGERVVTNVSRQPHLTGNCQQRVTRKILSEGTHLNSSTSSDYFPIFHSSFDNHDSIMKTPSHLLSELLGTTT